MTSIVTETQEYGDIKVHVVIDPERDLVYTCNRTISAFKRHRVVSSPFAVLEAKLDAYRTLLQRVGDDLYAAADQLDRFYAYEFKGTSLDDDPE